MAEIQTRGSPEADGAELGRPRDTVRNVEARALMRQAASALGQPGLREAASRILVRALEAFAGVFAVCLRWLPWALFVCLMFVLVGIGYFVISSEGLAVSFPTLGKKLSSVAVLDVLKRYQFWNRVTICQLLSVALEIVTFVMYDIAGRNWLSNKESGPSHFNRDRYRTACAIIATGTICGDAYLFYRGVQNLIYGSSGLSLGSLALSCIWVLLLAAVTLISLRLQPSKKENDHA